MGYGIITRGIYKIKNIKNNKVYIGSSVNIKARWQQHKSRLRKGNHHSISLQRAWKKYGEDNFEFTILEVVNNEISILDRENFYINQFQCANGRNGYNLLPVAGSPLGSKASDETKKRMSESQRKIPYEERLKYCVSFAGKKHTEETKSKMRANNQHTKPTEEQKLAISKVHKGKTISAEHRAIVGKATALKNKTPEMRAKVSAAHKGRIFTPEWRAKLSAAAKNRYAKSFLSHTDGAQPPRVNGDE